MASVLAVPELTYGAQWINFNTFRIVEVYAMVTPMYLVTGYVILGALRQLERRFAVQVGRCLQAMLSSMPSLGRGLWVDPGGVGDRGRCSRWCSG